MPSKLLLLLMLLAPAATQPPPPPPDVAETVGRLLDVAALLHGSNAALGPYERQQLQAAQAAQQRQLNADWASRPNLLLLFPDEWRYDWDTFHGPSILLHCGRGGCCGVWRARAQRLAKVLRPLKIILEDG